MSVATLDRAKVSGHISPGFESVREAFADNFVYRGELGGACCAYYMGEKVVDLWGGIRSKQTREPWDERTMVIATLANRRSQASSRRAPWSPNGRR